MMSIKFLFCTNTIVDALGYLLHIKGKDPALTMLKSSGGENHGNKTANV